MKVSILPYRPYPCFSRVWNQLAPRESASPVSSSPSQKWGIFSSHLNTTDPSVSVCLNKAPCFFSPITKMGDFFIASEINWQRRVFISPSFVSRLGCELFSRITKGLHLLHLSFRWHSWRGIFPRVSYQRTGSRVVKRSASRERWSTLLYIAWADMILWYPF